MSATGAGGGHAVHDFDPHVLGNDHPVLEQFWHPVALVAEVGPAPLGVQLLGRPYVLVRLGDELVALADECPHRGAPLHRGQVVDDTLQCPYHGYRFASGGRCVEIPALGGTDAIPARANAVSVQVEERYDLVWLAVGEPLTDIPTIPEWERDGWNCWATRVDTWQATAGTMLENFLDMAHLPLVHATTLGDPGDTAGETVDRHDLGFTLSYQQYAPDASGVRQPRAVEYVVSAPFAMRSEFTYPDASASFVGIGFLSPTGPRTTTTFGVRMTHGEGDWETFMDFQTKVVDEDRWVLESLHRPALHLDVRDEVHTTGDRAGVELRRMYSALVAAHTPEVVQ